MGKEIKILINCLFIIFIFLFLTSCTKINIKLKDNGKITDYTTNKTTVRDFFEDNDIEIGKDDEVSSSLDSPISDGDKIVITRIKTRNIKRTKKIKFKKETKYSSELYEGESKTEQKGQNGKYVITYYYKYINGYLKEKKVIGKKVLKKPKNEIVILGTKKKYTPHKNKGNAGNNTTGPREVSRQKVYDCDGSGHGYYVITYSDGSVKYKNF